MSDWKKSSASSYNGNCLEFRRTREVAARGFTRLRLRWLASHTWAKSSFSGYNGNCLEWRHIPKLMHTLFVRHYTVEFRNSSDSWWFRRNHKIRCDSAAWNGFLDDVKAGKFDSMDDKTIQTKQ